MSNIAIISARSGSKGGVHNMNIIVIGLGSMGKRRIRLIKTIYPEFVLYGIDTRADRRAEVKSLFDIVCFESISLIENDINCAFVCTSPLSHAGIINECLKRKWHVFTELNLVSDGYEENLKLAAENNCLLFLSSTFLYREEIRYIKSKICSGGKWNYTYHIGQYLPDWHPWENYNDFFIGNKQTSGCREIFAIELPWLIDTFGNIKKTYTLSDKLTKLNIGYNDNYMVQLVHENGCKGILLVDVVSPCAVRKFEAYTEGGYIVWNGTPDSLALFDPASKTLTPVPLFEKIEHRDNYAAFVVENAYGNEIKEFFESIENRKKLKYGFDKDKKILELIDTIGA